MLCLPCSLPISGDVFIRCERLHRTKCGKEMALSYELRDFSHKPTLSVVVYVLHGKWSHDFWLISVRGLWHKSWGFEPWDISVRAFVEMHVFTPENLSAEPWVMRYEIWVYEPDHETMFFLQSSLSDHRMWSFPNRELSGNEFTSTHLVYHLKWRFNYSDEWHRTVFSLQD